MAQFRGDKRCISGMIGAKKSAAKVNKIFAATLITMNKYPNARVPNIRCA